MPDAPTKGRSRDLLGALVCISGQASSRLWAVALSSLWRRSRKKAVQ